jgi:hypothetical protein
MKRAVKTFCDPTLPTKPRSPWEEFFRLRDQVKVPADFMSDRGDNPPQQRDLFQRPGVKPRRP